jgi:hypothetical protein
MPDVFHASLAGTPSRTTAALESRQFSPNSLEPFLIRSRKACLKPKLTDDWDKERKKQKVLSLVLVAVLLVAAVLFIISLLRKYL